MPHINIRVHLILSIINGRPSICSRVRSRLFEWIQNESCPTGLSITAVSGWHDHIHILASMSDEVSLEEAVRTLMADTRDWMRRRRGHSRFSWDRDFHATSVSESVVPDLEFWIRHQHLHHATNSFSSEIRGLRRLAGFYA